MRPQRLGTPGRAAASARSQAQPAGEPQPRPHPPCPLRHAGLRVLSSGLLLGHWCSAPAVGLPGALQSQPPEGGGGPGEQHRNKQTPGLSFSSSSGKWGQCPCCEGFQRTTAMQHPAHTHCVGARARAGAPESQAGGWAAPATLPTAASQPGGAAAVQKPALQTQMSLLTLRAPSCLPWGQQTRKSPSPRRREQTRLPLKQVRVPEALCLPPCGSGKIASQGVVLNQGLLGPGLEGGAWSQEPTLTGIRLPGPQGRLGPCIPTTRQVQAGRPCRRRQRAWRVVFDVTSLLQPHRCGRPAGRHGCALLVDENKTAGSDPPELPQPGGDKTRCRPPA